MAPLEMSSTGACCAADGAGMETSTVTGGAWPRGGRSGRTDVHDEGEDVLRSRRVARARQREAEVAEHGLHGFDGLLKVRVALYGELLHQLVEQLLGLAYGHAGIGLATANAGRVSGAGAETAAANQHDLQEGPVGVGEGGELDQLLAPVHEMIPGGAQVVHISTAREWRRGARISSGR